MSNSPTGTVVIGLGNPLMADDGFGIAVLERLRDEWKIDDGVELIDGGTWGITLLPEIERAERVLLLDAIDSSMPPGSETVLTREEIPRHLALKVSPHQVDLRETLALAELRGKLPEQLVAIGAQPAKVELRASLSPELEDHVDRVVSLAVDQLRFWGHRCSPARRFVDA